MAFWRTGTGGVRSVVSVVVSSSEGEDRGVGVVFSERPLTILVPLHLVVTLEADSDVRVLINGDEWTNPRLLKTPGLERDDLGLLRLSGGGARGLSCVRLPRHAPAVVAGQAVSLFASHDGRLDSREGHILEVTRQGDGSTILTDIAVSPGDSGSALVADNRLVGICQGMQPGAGAGNAIGVPLSDESLRELRRFRQRAGVRWLIGLLGGILVVLVGLVAFWGISQQTFVIGGIERMEDARSLRVSNARTFSLAPFWIRTFDSPIFCYLHVSERAGGCCSHVAVGTSRVDGDFGALTLLNVRGDIEWSYEVPDGECIYVSDEEVYDGFFPDRLLSGDLDGDGTNELIAAFVHETWFPCKLMVFALDGAVLAEYWHPGYIRTMTVGQVGTESTPLLLLSASNNRLRTSWWNPQTLFAFRGLDVSGQAPPYTGLDFPQGSELWYRQIVNVDAEALRAKGTEIIITDWNGDGLNEARFRLSDNRFFYLDEFGHTQRVDFTDHWYRDFGDAPSPPLLEIGLRDDFSLDVVVPNPSEPAS